MVILAALFLCVDDEIAYHLSVAVPVLADRFYPSTDLFEWLHQPGWHYRLRLKRTLSVDPGFGRSSNFILQLPFAHIFPSFQDHHGGHAIFPFARRRIRLSTILKRSSRESDSVPDTARTETATRSTSLANAVFAPETQQELAEDRSLLLGVPFTPAETGRRRVVL